MDNLQNSRYVVVDLKKGNILLYTKSLSIAIQRREHLPKTKTMGNRLRHNLQSPSCKISPWPPVMAVELLSLVPMAVWVAVDTFIFTVGQLFPVI